MKTKQIIGFIGVLALPFAPGVALATTYSTLHSFSASTEFQPVGGLVMTDDSHMYGTASAGSSDNRNPSGGSVFALTKSMLGVWTYSVIYDFCTLTSCADGRTPQASLIRDSSGNLYGTTVDGGAYGHGVIFKLTNSGGTWSSSVLYSFCASGGGCADGDNYAVNQSGLSYAGQSSGSAYNGTSPLYGVTQKGGSAGWGAAYAYTPGAGTPYQKIHDFCTAGLNSCTDGAYPSSPLTYNGLGNLYGVTSAAGHGGSTLGTVYELSPSGTTYSVTSLFTFCCQLGGGPNGLVPTAGLLVESAGIFGTTTVGGSYQNRTNNGAGVEFKLVSGTCSPDGWTEWCITVQHAFCADATDTTDCTLDGANPADGLPLAENGLVRYGEATQGGANGHGTVYSISGSLFQTLHAFSGVSPDGRSPEGGLVIDSTGNLFGITVYGGTSDNGTVFKITP